jgi:prophage DNA circulation protein
MSATVSGQTATGSAAVATGVQGIAPGSYIPVGPGLGPWAQGLQTASWRGLPFAVKSSEIKRGRRTALHVYPFRTEVWVEDLGRGVRHVSFNAFLLGDDVFAQRDAMAAACEIGESGPLVHPSLGALTATLMDFSAGERADLGRVVEINLSFIESGQDQPVFPSTAVSTQANTLAAATAADTACAADFASDVATVALLGESVLAAGLATAAGFVALATQAADDAALIFGAVAGLPGNNGRFNNGNLTVPLPATATVASAIASVVVNRAAVAAAGQAVAASVASTLPTNLQVLAGAVLTVANDPADQIRLLSGMAAFNPVIQPGLQALGAAGATFQTATSASCRRAALTNLARATAAYLPTSADDAITQIVAVTTLFDSEALIAADSGDTQSYMALEALRAALVQDLLTRGAQLPSLITVTRAVPVPSLTLAYELYGDATRADDITARANPVNPLFMPLSFQALSS